jgi:two-component system chemotaxis response regulator CheY
MRALVVDDARIIRVLVGKFLKTLGFDVLEAENGRAALDLLAGQPDVELIVVDWNMPVMGGQEFVQTFRARAGQRAVRILVMTAGEETFTGATALGAGADGHLHKPFTHDELQASLRSVKLLPG